MVFRASSCLLMAVEMATLTSKFPESVPYKYFILAPWGVTSQKNSNLIWIKTIPICIEYYSILLTNCVFNHLRNDTDTPHSITFISWKSSPQNTQKFDQQLVKNEVLRIDSLYILSTKKKLIGPTSRIAMCSASLGDNFLSKDMFDMRIWSK